MVISKNYINKLAELRINHEGKNIKNLKEIFENIKLLIIYNKKDFFYKKFHQNNEISSKSHMRFNVAAQTPRLFYEFILIVILLIFCIFFSSNLQSLIYVIAIFVAAAVRLIPSISKLLSAFQNIRFDIPALNEIIKNQNEVKKSILHKKNREDFNFSSCIELKNVFFSHNKSKNYIFQNLNLNIKKNSFVGIYGPSGIGKSTFFDLISGILIPTSGEIIIDNNIKLSEQNIETWQSKIGYIPQDSLILDDTFLNNVAFGEEKELINKKKFHDSIKSSNLNQFLSNLENKNLQILVREV